MSEPLRLKGGLEESIITALCWHDELAPWIAQALGEDADIFSTPQYRIIANRALDHLRQYSRPAGAHLVDLLDRQLERADGLYSHILARIEELRSSLQPDFLRAEFTDFYTRRQIEQEAGIILTEVVKPGSDIDPLRQRGFAIAMAGPPSPKLADPWAEPEPPEFQLDAVPQVLRAFVSERSEAMGTDPGALAWSALSADSAAIDGSTRLQMMPGFQVGPGVWVLLVSESSTTGRSPILRAAWDPLQDLQRDAIAEAAEKAKAAKAAGEDKAEIGSVRYVTDNATMEALHRILSKQDRGIALFKDEFAQLIGEFTKYSNSDVAYRAFLLQTYNGGPHTVDRADKMFHVNNLHCVLCGGVQPDRLRKLGDLTDDGLLQRANVVLVRAQGITAPQTPDRQARKYRHLMEWLAKQPGGNVVRLSPAAENVRRRVEERLDPLRRDRTLDAGFRTACGKLHGTWGRLALVLAYVDAHPRGAAPVDVSGEIAEMAEALIDNQLRHAARFYQWLAGGGADLERTQTICAFLLSKQRPRLTRSDLTAAHVVRGAAKDIPDAVSWLENADWLRPEKVLEGGRARSWTVNQAIYSQFAERAAEVIKSKARQRELIGESVARRRAERDHCDPSNLANHSCARTPKDQMGGVSDASVDVRQSGALDNYEYKRKEGNSNLHGRVRKQDWQENQNRNEPSPASTEQSHAYDPKPEQEERRVLKWRRYPVGVQR